MFAFLFWFVWWVGIYVAVARALWVAGVAYGRYWKDSQGWAFFCVVWPVLVFFLLFVPFWFLGEAFSKKLVKWFEEKR